MGAMYKGISLPTPKESFFKLDAPIVALGLMGCLMVGFILSLVVEHAPTIFPMEDAYLYHTYGQFLAKGQFYTYSINEPLSNGNTSFIYYLFIAAIHYGVSLFADNPTVGANFSLWIAFALHGLLYVVSICYFYKILSNAISNTLARLLIVAITFFNGPMLFAYFGGLETPVSIIFTLLFLHGVTAQRQRLEFAALLLMCLNRPENIATAVAYAIVVYLFILKQDGSKKATLLAPILITALLIPSLNYFFTDTVFTSSIGRTKFRNIDSLQTFISHITNWGTLRDSIIAMTSLVIPWATEFDHANSKFDILERVLLSPYYLATFFLTLTYFIRVTQPLRKLLLMVALWVAIVGLLGQVGEFSRYVIVMFPLINYCLGYFAFADVNKPAWQTNGLLVALSISFIPAFSSSINTIDHIDKGTLFLHSLHYQAALSLRNDPSVSSLAIWETGILSLYNAGHKEVIDIYGLGTTRYARTPRQPLTAKAVLISQDKPDVLVQWSNDPYQSTLLDELQQLGVQARLKETFVTPPSLSAWRSTYPHGLSIWELSYP